MKAKRLALMTFATALGLAAAAGAAEPAGMVKTLRGEVSLERAGRQQPAALGMPVFAGDRLRTGPDGAVGVTLRDDTRLAAGPGSSLLISDFRFDTTTQEGNLLVAMLKGTFNVITGLIARQNPGNATFTTPTLSLGVRGTEFIVDVDGGEP
jgi:hypothetical protein